LTDKAKVRAHVRIHYPQLGLVPEPAHASSHFAVQDPSCRERNIPTWNCEVGLRLRSSVLSARGRLLYERVPIALRGRRGPILHHDSHAAVHKFVPFGSFSGSKLQSCSQAKPCTSVMCAVQASEVRYLRPSPLFNVDIIPG
jgi:hypothetical protein